MEKKDYEEPRCPMDNSMWVEKKVTPIPTERVIAKEDTYLAQNDYAGAERHLKYWWQEAEQGNDERGKLVLCNELMGLYRKLANESSAKEYAQKALALVSALGLSGTISGATAYLNSGTVYKAFGEPEKSLEYFEKARAVYEKELEPDSGRKAGLYNNMALTLVDLERYDEAKELYLAAVEIISKINKADEAITWLNLADLAFARNGEHEITEEIRGYLDAAQKRLSSVPAEQRDGYYAFVCDKCYPVFEFYEYTDFAGELKQSAEAIYSANRER